MHTQHYHHTTVLSPTELKEAVQKAETQEQLVMWLFKAFNNSGFTPSRVWSDLIALRKIDRKTPITSIRRSISNLTHEGLLTKMDRQERGYYGRPETIWTLPVTQQVFKSQELFQ